MPRFTAGWGSWASRRESTRDDCGLAFSHGYGGNRPPCRNPLHGGPLPVPGLGRLQQACAKEREGPPSLPSFPPQPAWGKTFRLCLLPCVAGGHGGEDGPRGDKRNGRTRKDGREDGQDACRYIERDRPMQETAIADGVGERLSLEGDPVFEAPQTPYKKMPSWGGMRQAGCGEAKTVKAH